MSIFSRTQIAVLIMLVLVLALLGLAGAYYQVTAYLEDKSAFSYFEQSDFPDWAYCDRGVEYVLPGYSNERVVAVFHDREGRPLEGPQEFTVELIQKKEQDGPAAMVGLGPRKARAGLVQGVLEGPLEVWHENGQAALQCSYHQGLLEGKCKSFAPSGWLMNEIGYQAGKPTGVFIAYRQDGTLLSEGQGEVCQEFAIDGKALTKRISPQKAETKGCTPNSAELISEGQFVAHKEYKGLARDRSLAQSASIWNYYSGLEAQPLIYREMVRDGRMYRQETYLWDLHVVQDFDRKGVLRRELHDRLGVLEGTARWYDDRGRLRLEGTNRGGLRDGLFRWYGAGGKTAWLAVYCKGKLAGEEAFYSLLNWVIFLVVAAVSFMLFFPFYVWLRKKIKMQVLAYLAIFVLMLAVFVLASYFSFWIQVVYYS